MPFSKIPIGKNIPHDIYVIIEIPLGSHSVKYEIHKKYHFINVDRFIPTAMFYPCNYGYINNTYSMDGDNLDVLVYTQYSLYPGSVINCRPVGLLKMYDESGQDNKVIAVPNKDISNYYDDIQDIEDLPKVFKNKILHFFKHYKDIESNKWVKNLELTDIKMAKEEILNAVNRYKK